MTEKLKLRTLAEAEFIAEHNATVRMTADALGMGKSTVHTDVTVRLKEIDPELYKKVRKVLSYNYSVRHLRGGDATKRKYNSHDQ